AVSGIEVLGALVRGEHPQDRGPVAVVRQRLNGPFVQQPAKPAIPVPRMEVERIQLAQLRAGMAARWPERDEPGEMSFRTSGFHDQDGARAVWSTEHVG